MKDQPLPFQYVVQTTVGILTAGGVFAGAAAAANLSQGWVVYILLATALAAIGFVAAFFSSSIHKQNKRNQELQEDVRRKDEEIKNLKEDVDKASASPSVSEMDRDYTDWKKVHEALHHFSAIERGLQAKIARHDLDVRDCGQLTDKLFRTALIPIQTAVEQLCPDAVCSIKILRQNDEEEFFECIYGPNPPPKFHGFVEAFKVLSKESYAGSAFDKAAIVFVGNLWEEDEAGNQIQHPFSADVAVALRNSGVKGLVVAPIFLKNDKSGNFEPMAVFKIDFFVIDGLVDNHPTRRTIEFITTRLGSLLQQCLMLCGSTVDELKVARMA